MVKHMLGRWSGFTTRLAWEEGNLSLSQHVNRSVSFNKSAGLSSRCLSMRQLPWPWKSSGLECLPHLQDKLYPMWINSSPLKTLIDICRCRSAQACLSWPFSSRTPLQFNSNLEFVHVGWQFEASQWDADERVHSCSRKVILSSGQRCKLCKSRLIKVMACEGMRLAIVVWLLKVWMGRWHQQRDLVAGDGVAGDQKVIRPHIWAALLRPSAMAVKGKPHRSHSLLQVRLSMQFENNGPCSVRHKMETHNMKDLFRCFLSFWKVSHLEGDEISLEGHD